MTGSDILFYQIDINFKLNEFLPWLSQKLQQDKEKTENETDNFTAEVTVNLC